MYQSWDACVLMRFRFHFGQKLRIVGGCNKNALFEEWNKLQNWCDILKVLAKNSKFGAETTTNCLFFKMLWAHAIWAHVIWAHADSCYDIILNHLSVLRRLLLRCSSFVTSAFHWLDNSLRFYPVMASIKFIWNDQTCKYLAACSNSLQRFLFYNSPNSNKYSLSWDVKISWSKTLKATSFLIWQELVQILGGDIFLVALFLFPV